MKKQSIATTPYESLLYSPYSLKWCIIFSVFNNRRAQFLKNIILCESSFYASFQQSGLGQLQYKSPGAEICLCSVPKLTNLPSFEKVKIQNFSFSNFMRSAGFVPKARFLPLLKQGNRNTTPHSPNIRILSGLERNSKRCHTSYLCWVDEYENRNRKEYHFWALLHFEHKLRFA